MNNHIPTKQNYLYCVQRFFENHEIPGTYYFQNISKASHSGEILVYIVPGLTNLPFLPTATKFFVPVSNKQKLPCRLWGLDAQKRLRASRICLLGMTGLGCEVPLPFCCVNLILYGSGSSLTHDCVFGYRRLIE